MSDQQSTPSGGTGIWLIFGLVLSLALNAFFIGAVVGARASSDRWLDRVSAHGGIDRDSEYGPGRPGEMFDPRDLVRVLPDSARADAIAVLDEQGPVIRQMMRASGEARIASLEVMRATPFDAVALEDAFALSRQADAALSLTIHETMAALIADLTPEERAVMNEQLRERVPDFHRRSHRRREQREESREDRQRPYGDGDRDRD